MLTNNLLGIGYAGSLNVGPNAQGATLFVNSVYGVDNRGRVNFPGSSANSSGVGSSQGPQGNPVTPLATIAYALSLTVANRGDVIIVQQGHTESLAASITCANAGVTILGLGGPNSRPAITMNGFSYIHSGVGSQSVNINIVGGTTANVSGLVQLTGAGAAFIGGRISAANVTTVGLVLGAARTHVDSTELDGTTTGFATGVLFGAFDSCAVTNNNIHGIFASAPIGIAISTNVVVRNNLLRQLHATVDPVITGIVTGSSGTIADNRFQSVHAGTPAAYIGGANVATNILIVYIENYGFTGKAGPSSGVLIPAVGTIP